MATASDDSYFPAEDLRTCALSNDVEDHIKQSFEKLVKEVLELFPDCLAKVRKDSAYIFVPLHRRQNSTEKNLLTLWPRRSSMSIDIRPTEERETLIASEMPEYIKRLRERAKYLKD